MSSLRRISIHPMLFFITWNAGITVDGAYFNTSNVIFYHELMYKNGVSIQFQYIQCYFLSAAPTATPIPESDFNTSNVIFYPTVLSHFLIIILHKSLYFSRFLLYFTTLRQFFQIYFEKPIFPYIYWVFLDFSVFPPGKITGLMFLHYPLHRFLRLLY